MSKAILNNVNTIYHTGTFNTKDKVALSTAGLLGMTTLVIGILALLNSQGVFTIAGLGAVPQEVIYALIGVGGALVFADLIATTVLAIKHLSTKGAMEGVIHDDLLNPAHARVSEIEKTLRSFDVVEEGKPYCSAKKISSSFGNLNPPIYIITMVVGENKSLHVYHDEERALNLFEELGKNNFEKR